MQKIWYENLGRQDGSDGHQQRTHSMWHRIRQVEQFKYLGSIFVREGGCKEDVKTRCLKAAQVFYQLSPIPGHKEISMITKTQIIKAVFTPTLLYQSENWTLTSKERQMLTTTEMRCLRKAAGKTRMDKIRNEEIRRRLNMQPAEQTRTRSGGGHTSKGWHQRLLRAKHS